MGLMDKFKNLFTDEEIIEEDDADAIQIREVKKEEEVHKLPTFMREKIEKEEQEQHKQQESEREYQDQHKHQFTPVFPLISLFIRFLLLHYII